MLWGVEEMYSIGEFSARCGLSAKMLRSYAAAGLLIPALVDRSSGYRYYSAGQLHRARVIALLRQADIAIEEITRFLGRPDAAQLDRWDREIVDASAARRQALADARAALALDGARVEFRAGTATHRSRRDTNEDATLPGELLFAVADGIGGLDQGDVASQLALDTLGAAFAADGSVAGLLAACRAANEAVWRRAADEATTMGTTLAVLAVTSDTHAVVLHVGDSRLYRLRAGRLARLTTDHTVVAELLRHGELLAEVADTHPHRNVLTRAVGVGPRVEADYAGVSCDRGDRFLLCTDGLVDALPDKDLRAGLAAGGEPRAAAESLVASAVGRGAEDNVTAMVVDVR